MKQPFIGEWVGGSECHSINHSFGGSLVQSINQPAVNHATDRSVTKSIDLFDRRSKDF